MAPWSIWSTFEVILSSPDLAFKVLAMVKQGIILQINYSSENFYLFKIWKITQKMGLIIELELKAVNAVELLPLISVTRSELPGPVKVLNTFHF